MLLGTEAKSRRTPSPAEGKRKGRSEPKTTLTLPYISGLSEAIRRVLTPLGVKVVFRPLWTLHQMLVRLKEPVPVKEHKGVVCTIPCVESSSVYISPTGRSLKQRVNEHRQALKNLPWQGMCSRLNMQVLDHHQHASTRCMLESWNIKDNQAVLNRERGTLLEVYTVLLDWWAYTHLSPCFLTAHCFCKCSE